MMRSHRNFDFGDEQIISETGRTNADRFVIGEMAYRGVVLPELTTIRRSTLDKLVEFAEAGGTVVVCGDYPRFVDGEPRSRTARSSRVQLGSCAGGVDWGFARGKVAPRRSGSKGRVAIRSGPICAGYGTE
ncbi:MAG: hypothetical protein ACLR8Y_09455 [Alistipes indistinctus]